MSRRDTASKSLLSASIQRSGPLPAPADFSRYEDALPGAAERILAMAERQSAHRQTIEIKVISSDARNSTMGTIFAFFLGAIGLSVAGFVIQSGHDWAGVGIGGGTLTTMVISFLKRPRLPRKPAEE